MPIGRLLLLSLVTVGWGLNFVAAKWGYADFEPMLLLALRFLFVGLILLPFCTYPRGKMLHILGLSFVLGTVHFGLMFTGIKEVDAGVAAIAIQTQVPFAALLAALLFKDYLGWRRALGMILAFSGMVLIAGEPRMETSLVSLGMVILASMVWAVSTVQVKLMGEAPPFSVLAWSSLFAAPQLFVLSLLLEDDQWGQITNAAWYGWGAVVYMTLVVSVFGYGVWYTTLRQYDVNQVMPITLLVPLSGLASGAWILGETMTWLMWLGAALTLVGVAIIILRRPRTGQAPLKA
jgi:O-acetylserine/cysteine efflux transporter